MSLPQLRSNQLITTFGPGAMVDLPEKSVIVAGLDYWSYSADNLCIVEEPRLAAKVAKILGNLVPGYKGKSIQLRRPPPSEENPFARGNITPGITGFIFPHWYIVQNVVLTPSKLRRRRLVMGGQLTPQSKYRDSDGRSYPVVPIRFVRACRKGHVGDIQWRDFAHGGPTTCQQDLWLEERGTTGDLSDTWIACDCGANRQMSTATDPGALGQCNGSKPWMDDRDDSCGEPNRLLIRTASNAYFPQVLSVISIPNSMSKIEQVVLDLWETHLCKIESLDQLRQVKSLIPELLARIGSFDENEVFSTIENIRAGRETRAIARPVKEIEFGALSGAAAADITDEPDGDFFARKLESGCWADPAFTSIENIVQVHRLREVVALLGFTRFEPISADSSGELDIHVEQAPIVRAPKWMPVAENRGEGIFLQFNADVVETWAQKEPVVRRWEMLRGSFDQWKHDHPEAKDREMPPLPYLMLHSLSHLLLTTLSLECGYPLSSLRERIYAPDESGALEKQYGILILTASSDAEGTLGGLVHAAKDIRKHLLRALHQGMLCSNDPVCSTRGGRDHGVDKVSGSACHGCLYISETSCERFNQFLDRALVVPTIEQLGCEFFGI